MLSRHFLKKWTIESVTSKKTTDRLEGKTEILENVYPTQAQMSSFYLAYFSDENSAILIKVIFLHFIVKSVNIWNIYITQ